MQNEERAKRIVKRGTILSTKMNKTVVVNVNRSFKHPRYGKIITRGKKYYAHNEHTLNVGDEVVIQETRPLSKLKRWRVVEKVTS